MKVERGESQAVDLYVERGVLFLFPLKLSVGLQNIKNTNAFSKFISSLKV
jgi:hypothetical protein